MIKNRTTTETPAFFAALSIEAQDLNPTESIFCERLAKLVDTIPVNDCRILRNQVKDIAQELNLDMQIGCGGSHIWIHRSTEFISGENSNPKNKRFAIITDN